MGWRWRKEILLSFSVDLKRVRFELVVLFCFLEVIGFYSVELNLYLVFNRIIVEEF